AAAPAARVGGGGPAGGRAKIENSSRPHPRKFGLKRFLLMRRGASGKGGGPVLGLPPRKNFRRRDRDPLVPPRWKDAAVCPCRGVLSFLSEAREALGSETARVHHALRGRRGGVATRGARAAGADASRGVSEQQFASALRDHGGCLPAGLEGSR